MDPTSSNPPIYPRVVPAKCPQCERTTTTRLEHLIRGDVIVSNWVCTCGASWPADDDLAPRKVVGHAHPIVMRPDAPISFLVETP
jgi:hypothetical protein